MRYQSEGDQFWDGKLCTGGITAILTVGEDTWQKLLHVSLTVKVVDASRARILPSSHTRNVSKNMYNEIAFGGAEKSQFADQFAADESAQKKLSSS